MAWVAAAILALTSAHHAVRPSLDAYPRNFSPNAGALVVSATLPAPAKVGLRLVTTSNRQLAWLLRPALRSEFDYQWHGALDGTRLRDGWYALELVSGKRVLAETSFRLDTKAPFLTGFKTDNEGPPFAGDTAMLTTVTPNGDHVRDEARVSFTLDEAAMVALQVVQTQRIGKVVAAETVRYGPGRHELVWAPDPKTPPRTYVLDLTVTDAAGNARSYGAQTAYVDRFRPSPVVRVLGIDAYMTHQSYAPGQEAVLRVATDAPSFSLQFFRVGGEARRSYLPNEMSGVPVSDPQTISWSRHTNAPFSIRLRIGDWRSGVFFARMEAPDGRLGYAPFIVRPAVLGGLSRVAVVMPTNTWQAYNFHDDDGDGWPNTWYAGRDDLTVRLDRPYINRGVPPKFSSYDTPFLNWVARSGFHPDFLAESDLTTVQSGRDLAAGYDLIVFPTHTEYVTDHEYDLIEQYRDAGGNLIFLSANNFFRRVVKRNGVLTRMAPWRTLGRPEAALLGAQYRANDEGERQGNFVVGSTALVPWLWDKTGLTDGSIFGDVVGGYGVEIDATTKDSPPGTIVLAEIPDLFGPGVSAQMTYYETPEGAKVFDAGTLDFVGSSLIWPVKRMLLNLWNHLSQP